MESPGWPKIQERAFMAPSSSSNSRVMDQQAAGMKGQTDLALKCPRCDSLNTKFCYYNNYSLSQPRHFCKACKRYWTRGGTLRNVPVGGGCRKNKRIKRTTTTLDDGGTSSHFKGTTETTATVSSCLSSLPPLNSTPSLSSITTTSAATTCSALQNPVFLSPELHVNNSLVSSLKSVLSSELGFPAKDNDIECNFLRVQNGFNNTISISGASSLLIPEAFPHLGHSLDGLSEHITNGMIPHSQWRSPVQPQNFFLPLDELGSGGNNQLPKLTGENTRNFSVKVEDDSNRSGHQLDWQASNLNGIGTNSNETFTYWNASVGSWTDITNYGSTVASLM